MRALGLLGLLLAAGCRADLDDVAWVEPEEAFRIHDRWLLIYRKVPD